MINLEMIKWQNSVNEIDFCREIEEMKRLTNKFKYVI